MCLFVSMVYTMYLPNTLNLIVCLESFRDHKGTDKAPILKGPHKKNNLVNYFKIFLLFFSKFTSSNILDQIRPYRLNHKGHYQINSMLRPCYLVNGPPVAPIWVYILGYLKTSKDSLRHLGISKHI